MIHQYFQDVWWRDFVSPAVRVALVNQAIAIIINRPRRIEVDLVTPTFQAVIDFVQIVSRQHADDVRVIEEGFELSLPLRSQVINLIEDEVVIRAKVRCDQATDAFTPIYDPINLLRAVASNELDERYILATNDNIIEVLTEDFSEGRLT